MKPTIPFAVLFVLLNFWVPDLANAQATNASPSNVVAPAAKKNDMAAFFQMHWTDRVHAFNEQNLAWRNVVLLGDSITEGFDVAKYFPGRRVLNRGIGADVIGNGLPADDTRGVLRRLDSSVYDCAATDVFILIGINDLGNGHNVDEMAQGYREMVQNIRTNAPTVRIHIQSVLPTRGNFAHHNPNIIAFNERLQKLAAEFGCDYLNLHDLMTDEHGELKAEFTREGLHLTAPAYVVWQAEIIKAMGWDK
jgi:lysophospholipase L1-like esterase